MHVSGFGVISKRHQTDKWRLIVDLSSPDGNSVNDRATCSLSYVTVDVIAQVALQLARPRGTNREDRHKARVPSSPRPSGGQVSPRYVLAWAGVRGLPPAVRAPLGAPDILGGRRCPGVGRESAYGERHSYLPLYRRLRRRRPSAIRCLRIELASRDADLRQLGGPHRTREDRGPDNPHHSAGHRVRDGAASTGRQARASGAHTLHVAGKKVWYPQRSGVASRHVPTRLQCRTPRKIFHASNLRPPCWDARVQTVLHGAPERRVPGRHRMVGYVRHSMEWGFAPPPAAFGCSRRRSVVGRVRVVGLRGNVAVNVVPGPLGDDAHSHEEHSGQGILPDRTSGNHVGTRVARGLGPVSTEQW